MKEIDALIEKLTQEYSVPRTLIDALCNTDTDKASRNLKNLRDYIFKLKPVTGAKKQPTKFFFFGTISQIQQKSRLALSNKKKPPMQPLSICGVFNSPDEVFRPSVVAEGFQLDKNDGEKYALMTHGFFPVSEEQAKAFMGDGMK